jgi:diaminopimelate epimerase
VPGPPHALPFVKVEGLGNDFVLLDRRADSDVAGLLAEVRRRAPQWCDRRTGVGADGVLVLAAPAAAGADARMVVVNADGSVPEMCGNGVRCAAQYLTWSAPQARDRAWILETDAGPRRCVVHESTGDEGLVEVEMGVARDDGFVDAAGLRWHAVDVGNPHAIRFVDAAEAASDAATAIATLGPRVERDPAFPRGTNVEIVERLGDGSLRMHVWERGCGLTRACGTGACATAAAAVLEGYRPPGSETVVHLPGGDLRIVVDADPRVELRMIGPARLVYRGTLPPVAPPPLLA